MDRSTDGTRLRTITYAALPSQQRFHDSDARFKGLSGPIGSGKSQALCQEAIRLAYLNPGRQGLLGAPTYAMLRDATLATLFEILGGNRIPYEHNKAENVIVLKDTRSKILVRSLDEFERLRGTNLSWFGVDELTYTAEEAWLRLEGRLRDPRGKRLCGFAVWTPKGFDWVYKRFLKDPIAGYEAIVAQPFENTHLLDRIPDYYERLQRSYDTRFYQQEVLGEYLNINSGRVYQAFDRQVNVVDCKPDSSAPLMWTLDFNVDPMSSLVAQRRGDTVQVLDEIVLSRATTVEACEEFRNRYAMWAAGIAVYGDATGARMQTTGKSDYGMLREFFAHNGYAAVRFENLTSNPPVTARVRLVNSMLQAQDGGCKLLIAPRCRELIKDFEEVTFKPESGVIDKERDSKRTHLSDALGYLLCTQFMSKAPFGEQDARMF